MTAPLEVFVGIGHAPPCGEGKVWLSRAPGEGIRFQLESVGLDRLTVELDRIESVLPSRSDLVCVLVEPEQSLHPSEHPHITKWVISMIRKGHRVHLHTHSPYILYGLNNALLAGQVRRNASLPAEFPLDFWLGPDDVEAYRILPNREKESIFDPVMGLIDASDLDDPAAALAAEFTTLQNLLPPDPPNPPNPQGEVRKIVGNLQKEFRNRYKGGWFLLSSPVRGALLFERAVRDAITQARITSTQIDPEYLDQIYKEIQEDE